MSRTPSIHRIEQVGHRRVEHPEVLWPEVGRDAADVAAAVGRLLRAEDVHAALSFLNARTRFRFTGLLPMESDAPGRGQLFDRENPALRLASAAHPAGTALSCAAVPLRVRSGRVWGTLCHYDYRPRLLRTQEREVLEAVGPVVVAWLDDRPRRV